MNSIRKNELERIAYQLRLLGLKMVREVNSGHIGGAFSLSEIISVLYFEKMNIRPDEPQWKDRDRLVLSKGHATVALYPALALRGFFPIDDLKMFRKIDGHLSGHAEMRFVPGVDMSTGSLGQGLSTALGMALAGRQLKSNCITYAILGDGEIAEGQVWEASMFAAANKLDNLIVILDYNKVQLDGTVKEVLDSGDLKAKFESFGFFVQKIDGHNVEEIDEAIDAAKDNKDTPSIIIANTVKGKGVSFMEGKSYWHGNTPNNEQFEMAFNELSQKFKALEV